MDKVAYLIFDCEAIADGDLITRVRYPHDALTGPLAIRRYFASGSRQSRRRVRTRP